MRPSDHVADLHSPFLHMVVRTPHQIAFEQNVFSLRLPTETGQVGLRPRGEGMIMAVEAGVVIARSPRGTCYIGTAGGLMVFDGSRAILLTPIAAAGEDQATIVARLTKLLAEPDEEMRARIALGRLETQILQRMRDENREAVLRPAEG